VRVSRETIAAIGLSILLPSASPVAAATVSGGPALALAALVGLRSPALPRFDKAVLAKLFDDQFVFAFAAGKTIAVAADAITCRASDVDIALHACDLAFGAARVALDGRPAHELMATVLEAGIKSEGTAGSLTVSLRNLACTIDPHAVKERAGGGAQCRFDAASP
jgi:hypothetical protein